MACLFLFGFIAPGFAAPDKRVALVIGNNAYKELHALDNPGADAESLAKLLAGRGFDTISCDGKRPGCFDLTRDGLSAAIAQLKAKSQDAALAFVFYAGHGMERARRQRARPRRCRRRLRAPAGRARRAGGRGAGSAGRRQAENRRARRLPQQSAGRNLPARHQGQAHLPRFQGPRCRQLPAGQLDQARPSGGRRARRRAFALRPRAAGRAFGHAECAIRPGVQPRLQDRDRGDLEGQLHANPRSADPGRRA